MFPAPKSPEPDTPQQPNTSKRRAEPVRPVRKRSTTSDDFGDDGIDDDELMKVSVGDLEFEHIDNFANPMDAVTRKNTAKNKTTKLKSQANPIASGVDDDDQDPVQLSNGKWACNHKCKDKNACKHLCCKDGLDKPPKKSAATKRRPSGEVDPEATPRGSTQKVPQKQSKLQLTASKRKVSSAIEELDLTQQEKKKKADYGNNGPRDYRDLHQLHKNIQKKDPPATLLSVMHKKPAYCYSQGGDYNLSFLQQPGTGYTDGSSDYGDVPLDDLSPHFEPSQPMTSQQNPVRFNEDMDTNDYMDYPATAPVTSRGSDIFGDDDSLLGDAMVGLADSQNLQQTRNDNHDSMDTLEEALNMEYEGSLHDDDIPMDIEYAVNADNDWSMRDEAPKTPVVSAPKFSTQNRQLPFAESSSSPYRRPNDFKPAKTMLKGPELQELKQPKTIPPRTRVEASKMIVEEDIDVLDLLDDFDDGPVKEVKPVTEGFRDLQPWLFQEFGDIVELVDE
jgi:ATP-dependent DNA helicase HFM1/MER3